ncbi:helix-turn-helix transcriptional regulator [Acidisoma sp. 7E03]
MRRADRLFQIIQILRRSSRPVTAKALAAELEISPRSVYRDMADLMAQRVPIQGEAGIGYLLGRDFDMPPLMLTPDELEAAMLGAQWVAERGDAVLAQAARDLIAKLNAVLPGHLQAVITDPATGPLPPLEQSIDRIDMARTRLWIRQGRKIRLRYRDQDGKESERVIWPVVIGYAEAVRLVAGWCETRQDFRSFRSDRIVDAVFLEERHSMRPAVLRAEWQRHLALRRAARPIKP